MQEPGEQLMPAYSLRKHNYQQLGQWAGLAVRASEAQKALE